MMLATFHELGMVLHFASAPEIVILQPQWLVDAICLLICDFSLHGHKQAHEEVTVQHAQSFERLKHTGIATKPLLYTLWRSYDKTPEDDICRTFLIRLLQDLSMMCPISQDAPPDTTCVSQLLDTC